MSHCTISSPDVHITPIPRTYIITNINMVRSVDSAKLKKLISFIRMVPYLGLPDTMR